MTYVLNYNNGLRAAIHKMKESFTVCFGIYVNCGSAFEEKEENGYSHLIEHMLFKGTGNKTAKQISEYTENLGAEINAFTSKDSTCFFVRCFPDDLEKCFALLSDMFFNSTFADKELNAEKKVVIEEIAMSNDIPDEVCYELVSEAIFHNQKLGRTISGTVENVTSATRKMLTSFMRKHYTAKNVVISVAGNLDEKKTEFLLNKYFVSCFGEKKSALNKEDEVVYTYEHLEKPFDSEQCHISYAFKAFSLTDSKQPCARILSTILGGGLSSRLFQKVREENGLAYSVYSFLPTYVSGGYFQIYCGTGRANLKRVNEIVFSVLNELLKHGITADELARAKTQAVKGLYMSYENCRAVMSVNARRLLKCNEIINLEEEKAKYERITIDEVNEVAHNVFETRQFATSFVGKDGRSFYL